MTMCGIVGQISFSDWSRTINASALLEPLIDRMARRGPDDSGLWNDGPVTLGHRRLAILDLSAASHQPLLSDDGRFVIVCNGEIYNYQELRRQLEGNGQRFRSTGDIEVALYALARWGEQALDRFNGMFALGFYDKLTKRLLLARDHAGIKPLYYSHTSHGLVFASQFDLVLDHPWTNDSKISPAALGLYLRLGYIPAPYGLLDGSHMLEPGTWLSIDCDNRLRQERFFEFPQYREPVLSGETAHEAVDAAVRAAVRRQLISDVPVGTFLSGGIDSPLITANYCAASNRELRSFTIGTQGDMHDESADATTYASELGVEHFLEQLSQASAMQLIDDVIAACGEPFADYSIFPTLAVSRLARQHVKVVLSGDGGDELFWGYPYRYASLLANLAAAGTSTETTTSQRLAKILSTQPESANERWPGTIGEIYRLNLTRLSEPWLKRIFPDLPEWPTEFELFNYADTDPNRTAQWLRWNDFTSHLVMVLLKVDRGSMFHSLEVRVPLLDREVIEVASQVEWQTCLDSERKIGKLPLRHSLARHLTKPTLAKRGFTVAMDDWLRGSLRSLYEELVLSRNQLLGLPLSQSAARDMFDRHLTKKANFDWLLWTLLSLALWEERYMHGRNIAMATESSLAS